MYTPAHFAILDRAEIHRIITAYPLGILVTPGDAGMDANHIPFDLDPAAGAFGRLSGHVARANPLWQQCLAGADVLVIFRGAEGYISPNWYPSKHETHRLVPTWNYEAVHVHGRLTVRDDEKFVRGVVGRLTRKHEAQAALRSEPHAVGQRGGGYHRAWKMTDADPAFIRGMLQAVVGIEIDITRLEGKAKLSQNREPRDVQGAVKVLRERGGEALAHAMERLINE